MKPSLAVILSLFMLSVAACGDDDAPAIDAAIPDAAIPDAAIPDAAPPGPDARPADVSCAGDEPPVVTVPDPLTVAGAARDAQSDDPLVAAVVTAHDDEDLVVATTETAADGAYQLSIPTGAVPVQGYIRIVATDYATANLFAPDPLQENVAGLNLIVFAKSTLSLLGLFFEEIMPERAILAIGVVDCMNQDVEGAVVTVSNGDADTQIRYLGTDGFPSTTLTATSSNGTALIANVPAGDLTVNATVGGVPFQAVTIKAFADQVTLTQIHP